MKIELLSAKKIEVIVVFSALIQKTIKTNLRGKIKIRNKWEYPAILLNFSMLFVSPLYYG